MARRRFGGGGSVLEKVFLAGVMGYIILMFVMEFAPEIETAITGFTSTLPMVEWGVGLLSWLIPVALLVLAVVFLVRKFRN